MPKEFLGATVEVFKRSELHKFSVIPKRWVVELSFAWLEKCHRLRKNCERKLDSTLAMIELAFVGLLVSVRFGMATCGPSRRGLDGLGKLGHGWRHGFIGT